MLDEVNLIMLVLLIWALVAWYIAVMNTEYLIHAEPAALIAR